MKEFNENLSVAESISEIYAAFKLVCMRYQEFGYIADHDAHDLHFSPTVMLPSSWILISRNRGEICGTGSLVLDSYVELPCENTFSGQVQYLRSRGRKLCEGTMLAFKERSPRRASVDLIRHAIAVARFHQVDDALIVANPRHASFWVDALGGECLESANACEYVNNAPGVLIRLPLREWFVTKSREIPQYFREDLTQVVESIEAQRYQMSSEDVLGLLIRHRRVLSRMSSSVMQTLCRSYPILKHLKPHVPSRMDRDEPRASCDFKEFQAGLLSA